MDKDILRVLKGELADMMIQIAPQVYRKYVAVNKKRTPILYKENWRTTDSQSIHTIHV